MLPIFVKSIENPLNCWKLPKSDILQRNPKDRRDSDESRKKYRNGIWLNPKCWIKMDNQQLTFLFNAFKERNSSTTRVFTRRIK